MVSPIDFVQRKRTLSNGQIRALPVVVLMPHSGCNCRCVMCDIWKANKERREIAPDELDRHLGDFKRLRVRRVVLSGGEALMHSNLWALCERLKQLRIKITLLSSGILLKPHAKNVAKWCDDVIVSLDGSPKVHDRIRNVEGACAKLQAGVRALREVKPRLRITARSVIQRKNYFDIGKIIETARLLPVDRLSFLAADVSSSAFNRDVPWEGTADVALTPEEITHFELVVRDVLHTHRKAFSSGFVAESPDKIRGLVRYYRAINDEDTFSVPQCNAPWVSTVIETDGTVRPCFFHAPIGNINEASLDEIVNGKRAADFRASLDMTEDPICRRCVCTLNLRPHQRP